MNKLTNRVMGIAAFVVLLASTSLGWVYHDNGPLNSDPESWVCPAPEPTEEEMQTWCDAHPDRGSSHNLGVPGSLLTLTEKNAYDFQLAEFVISGEYKTLGWLSDKNWRMTGPYMGKPGEGLSYGVHPAVRIYYSPEMVDWMCAGRPEGGVPDGAMIIKEMHDINEQLKIYNNDKGCMEFGATNEALDESMSSWTIMVKDKEASHDGWYWANPYKTYAEYGNPPIIDKSAFAKADQVPKNPTQPNPDMYPTGNASKIATQVYPYNGFGVACLNCHGSAQVESTFISLENLMSEGIQYKGYKLDESQTKPSYDTEFPQPLAEPSPSFLQQFDQMHSVSFSQAWHLRFPSETFDHVVAPENMKREFLTSDQCIACHDATISNDALPNMMYKEANGTLINLSMYGEWRASPMGLAGRDPIFFSQLQSETNNLPGLAECIENTCLHCHGVLGQRQYSRATERAPDAGKCTSLFPVPPPAGVPEGSPYPLSMVTEWQNNNQQEYAKFGALSRDGISCMACHQMEANDLNTVDNNTHINGMSDQYQSNLSKNEPYYTGNFITTNKNEVFGPIKDQDIVPKPMQHVLGIKPTFGKQISDSEMCGNCHNILLPEIANDGQVVGASYEQSTHLEWVNSDFANPSTGKFQSCQDCHMPHSYKDNKLTFKIANIESDRFAPTTYRLPDDEIQLKPVKDYSRHALHGLNVFLNQMFQQFPEVLGVRQIDYMNGINKPSLMTGQDSMIHMAKSETATVSIQSIKKRKNTLDVSVLVTNLAGHYYPSGVGFRRAFLELKLLNESGDLLWASGRTNELGFILNGTTETVLDTELPVQNPKIWQPHYETINNGSQVQIYQEVILDSEDDVTTSFLRRIKHVKDNRIRPLGFDPQFFADQSSQYIQKLAELDGVEDDPYYFDPRKTGADQISYSIKLDDKKIAQAHEVQVTLYNQSIPPGYLQQRFRDAGRGPKKNNEISRLYYLTSHLNVDEPVDEYGNSIIQDWKLKVGDTAVKSVLP